MLGMHPLSMEGVFLRSIQSNSFYVLASVLGGLMFGRILCVVFGVLGMSVAAMAADFGSGKYEVYIGDLNDDDVDDVYLHAKEQIILLHGDIVTPIVVPPGNSFRTGSSLSIDIHSISVGAGNGGDSSTTHYYVDEVFAELVEPVFSENERDVYGLVQAEENVNYFYGDFDGDGISDVLVIVPGYGVSAPGISAMAQGEGFFSNDLELTYVPDRIVLVTGGEVPTSASQMIKGLLAGQQSIILNPQNYVVLDHDGDGNDELVYLGGQNAADVAYSFEITQVSRYDGSGGFRDVNTLSYDYEIYDQPLGIKTATLNGASTGSFRVSESGAATYTVPLSLPAGTAGVAPEIALSYSSQGGNGLLGWGWNMSGISSVTRCKKSLLLDGQASPASWDGSIFCYNGQRLLEVGESAGVTTYATATETHVEIKSYGDKHNPDYFQLIARDGSLSVFGDTLDAKQVGLEGSYNAWNINKFTDSVGNAITYDYSQDNGNNYRVESISYAYATGITPHAVIEFNYEDRQDVLRGYVAGREYVTDQRLKTVVVKNNEPSNPDIEGLQEVRTYSLHYYRSSPEQAFAQSRVHALQECVANQCLPPVTFDWAREEIVHKYAEPVLTDDLTSRSNTVGSATPIDVNGDGYLDMAWIEYREHNGDEFYLIRYAMFDPEAGQLGPKMAEWIDWQVGQDCGMNKTATRMQWCENWTNKHEGMSLQSVDYNGDGRQDLAIFRDKFNRWQIHLSKPNADGTWQLSGEVVEYLDFSSPYAMFMDADSDGVSDLVTPTHVHYAGRKVNEADSSPSPFTFDISQGARVDNIQWVWDVNRTSITLPDSNDKQELAFIQSGDFNGDGLADLIFADRLVERYDSSGYSAITIYRVSDITDHYYLAFAEGDGKYRVVEYLGVEKRRGNQNDAWGARLLPAQNYFTSDINGDGYTDIVRNTQPGVDVFEFEYLLNTGDGFETPQLLDNLKFWTQIGASGHNLTLQDINGDGFSDLLVTNNSNASARYRPWNSATQSFGDVQIIYSGTALNGSDSRSMFYDATGDGRLDLVFFSRDRFGISANLGEGPRNVVTSITNGLGATTDITYETMHNSDHYRGVQYAATDESGVFDVDEFYRLINAPFMDVAGSERLTLDRAPVLEYLTPMQLVTAIDDDAPAASETQPEQINQNSRVRLEYYYYQARMQAGGQGPLGFRALLTEDPQNDVLTTSFYRQDWPFVGMPMRTEMRTFDGELMSLSETEWGLIGWDGTWQDTIDSSSTGISVLGPIKPYLKEVAQTTYQYQTSNDDPSGIEPIYEKTRTVMHCKQGAICQSGSTDIAEAQSVVTSHKHDSYGNLTETTTTTTGSGLTLVSVLTNTYPSDQLITLHGESKSYAELGRISFTRNESSRAGAAMQVRESSFDYYESGVLAGLLKTEVVEPNQPDHKVTTTYQYDLQGNKTRADTVAKNHQYDFAGNIVSSIDQTRSKTFSMDSTYRYVDTTYTVLNGEEFSKEIVVARNAFGAPTLIRSAVSDYEVSVDYDVLGREIYRSDNADTVNNDGLGGWSRTEYLKCSGSMRCPVATSYVVRKTDASGGLSLSFFDILGRETRTATQMFDGRLTYVDTEYNAKGHALRKSEPYFVGETRYWTESVLDTLGRPVLTTMPDGSQQSLRYNGYTTTFTNALGVTRSEKKNGLGELVSVSEALGAALEYVYDSNGNLQFIRSLPAVGDLHDQVIETEVRYDSLNRKIWMDDPDKGVWEYKYNAFGELVWQRNANGHVVTQEHDASGRMIKRTDYKSGGTVEGVTTWYYDGYTDTSPNERVVSNALMQVSGIVMRDSVGGVCDAASAIQCVYPSYDRFGRSRATTVRQGIDGQLHSYATETSYDDIGRVVTQTDALNAVVVSDRSSDVRYLDDSIQSGTQNHYNVYGFLESVSDLQTGKTVFTLLASNARGQATEILRGNGVTSRNEYDAATGQIREQTGDVTDIFKVQRITYTWDVLGNLTNRVNGSMQVSGQGQRNLQESFCYDDLNRLIKTNANTTSTSGCNGLSADDQDMRYDSRGNIAYKHDVGAYTYDTNLAGPHAVTSTSSGDRYEYDDNGNMTASFGVMRRQLAYSTYDKVTSIIKGDVTAPEHTTSFKYGIDRARFWREDVKDNGETITTQYLGGVEKITKSTEPNKIYWKRYLGKTAIITLTTDENNVLQPGADDYNELYVYNDHLGSLDVITDAGGTVIQSMSFDPWGQRRDADSWADLDFTSLSVVASLRANTTRGYTGHEMLDEVGIIHMNGRIYDARLARFMQADPIIQAATSTQSYNRYAYVWNNPLNATDPSGYIKRHVLQKAVRVVAAIVIAVVSFIACGPACTAATVQGVLISMAVGAAAGAMGAAINGASGSGILKGALTGALTAGVGAYANMAGWAKYLRYAAMGVAGGASSLIQGGKFGHGFVSGAMGSASSGLGGISGMIASAVVGGAVSKATGGKFESGAATAAFSYVASGGLTRGRDGDSGETTETAGTKGNSIKSCSSSACADKQIDSNGNEIVADSGFMKVGTGKTSVRRIPGSKTFERPVYNKDGSIAKLLKVTGNEKTITMPAKGVLKKFLPKPVAEALNDAADLEVGYREYQEYEIWEQVEYVEGVIYDTQTPGQIGDVISGPYPVWPSSRATGNYTYKPTPKVYRESIMKVCGAGSCRTFGAWDE